MSTEPRDKLYEFLYDENYEPWFIHIFKEMTNVVNERIFKERIINLLRDKRMKG